MYNLPTLQRKHPKLKQLNNWTTYQNGGLLAEQTEQTSSLPSHSQVTSLDLGDGRPALSKRTLPPIAATGWVDNEEKPGEGEMTNEERQAMFASFAKVSPLATPPVKDVSIMTVQGRTNIDDFKKNLKTLFEDSYFLLSIGRLIKCMYEFVISALFY